VNTGPTSEPRGPGAAPAPFRGGLAVLSGPSGSGKTSICKALLEDPRVDLSVSATTRPPRAGERNGVEYWFHEDSEFRRMAAAGEFVEWAEVYGQLYGTPLAPLIAASRCRDRLFLLDIDVQGAAKLRAKSIAATFLFIAPPTMDVLRQRLLARATDRPDVIARRLESATREMEQRFLYDHVLVNDSLAATIARARAILGLST
jgi:guanylate kinase